MLNPLPQHSSTRFMTDYFIAWWNVENLFDASGSKDRPGWLKRRLQHELKGWTQKVVARKVRQLASIIVQMDGGRGPDLLGVCEAENRPVLEELVGALGSLGRNYQLAHHDASDQRGIDVAFIYDANLFSAEEQFFHVILKRTATRDLFQVNFRTAAGRRLILIGNHWPARSGGIYESEPYRIIAAETLSYWLRRIQEIHGMNVPVLVLGDFNDEPHDRSLVEYARSCRLRKRVTYARSPRLLNLMWDLLGQGIGTHYFNNDPTMLDQFLVSRGLARLEGNLVIRPGSERLERFPEMVNTGRYPSPIRFGRPSSTFNPRGFSDHFPISLRLRET